MYKALQPMKKRTMYFCERMVENYLNDPDSEKDESFTLEECKREWGLDDV